MGLIKVKNKPPFCDIFGHGHISTRTLSIKCGCHINLIWLSSVIQAFLAKITRCCAGSNWMLSNYKARADYVADRPCGWMTLPCSFTLVEIGKIFNIKIFLLKLSRKSLEYFIGRAFLWLTFTLESKNKADKVQSGSKQVRYIVDFLFINSVLNI